MFLIALLNVPLTSNFLTGNYWSELKKQLLDDHNVDIQSNSFIRGVYNLNIERFRKSIYGPLHEEDPTAYRMKEIEHLEELVSNEREHVRMSIDHIAKGRMNR